MDMCQHGIGGINTFPPFCLLNTVTRDSRCETHERAECFNIMSLYDLRTICNQVVFGEGKENTQAPPLTLISRGDTSVRSVFLSF